MKLKMLWIGYLRCYSFFKKEKEKKETLLEQPSLAVAINKNIFRAN